MSPDEVRACYRLFAADRASRGIDRLRRLLASLGVPLHGKIFKEMFAKIFWAELKTPT